VNRLPNVLYSLTSLGAEGAGGERGGDQERGHHQEEQDLNTGKLPYSVTWYSTPVSSMVLLYKTAIQPQSFNTF
jgi:hypothetical protein